MRNAGSFDALAGSDTRAGLGDFRGTGRDGTERDGAAQPVGGDDQRQGLEVERARGRGPMSRPGFGFEEYRQQVDVEQDRDDHRSVGQRRIDELQLHDDPGKSESHNPQIESHADAPEGLRIEAANREGAQGYAYEHARDD